MNQLKRLFGSLVFPALLIVLLDLVAYHYFLWRDATGSPKLVAHWDFAYAYFPWFVYLSDVIRAGSWPLWCPYVGGGTPFFINPGTALFSPITWLVALTVGYSEYVAQVQYVLTIIVAALGAYTLALPLRCSRWGAFVSGVCFGLSSAVYGNFEHGPFLNAFALMPWVFYFLYQLLWEGDRRALIGLSLVYYLLIVCSAVFVVMNIVLWSLLWSVYLVRRADLSVAEQWRRLGSMVTTGLLLLAITAAFWLPVVRSIGELTRGKPLTLHQALHGGNLNFKHLWGLIFNFMAYHPLSGYNPDLSMIGVYVGALALPLIAIAVLRRRDVWTWPLLLLAVLSLGNALGDQFPPAVWLHTLLPALNFTRFPAGDHRTLFALGMVLMAGRGWTVLEEGDEIARKLGLAVLCAMLAILIGGWFVLPPFYTLATFAQIRMFLAAEVVLTALAAGAMLMLRYSPARALYLTLLAADLALGFRANMFIAGEVPPPGYAEKLVARHQAGFDVASALVPRVTPKHDWKSPAGASADQEAADGYISKRFYVAEYNPLRLGRLDRLLAQGLQPYMENGPRVAFWSSPRLPDTVRAFLMAVKPVGFKIGSYLPNSVSYTVNATTPGLLVFNEIYFPGWRANVDGQDVAMIPVLDGLRGLPVTAGNHTIETYFHPDIFYQALWVSGFGLALYFPWLFWMLRRRDVRAISQAV